MGIKQRVYVETYTLPIVFGTGQILQGKGNMFMNLTQMP